MVYPFTLGDGTWLISRQGLSCRATRSQKAAIRWLRGENSDLTLERRRVSAFVGSGWVADAGADGEGGDGRVGHAAVFALVFRLLAAFIEFVFAFVRTERVANAGT